MCCCLFLNLLLEFFSNKEQFHLVHEHPSPQEAAEGAMNLIKNLPTKHGLEGIFSFSPGKAPPKAWWVKPLKMGFKTFGIPEGDWREIHSRFRQELVE